MNNNFTYSQEREEERKNNIIRNDVSKHEHIKEVNKKVKAYAAKICNQYGFSAIVRNNIVALIGYDSNNVREIPAKIEYILAALQRYNYSYDESIEILEKNNLLLKHSLSDLIHTLAITKQYGLEENILTTPTIYSGITDKSIYSLIEELKENGIEVTMENVTNLYIRLSNAGSLLKLNELHPLTQRVIFKYRALYDQEIRNSNKTK